MAVAGGANTRAASSPLYVIRRTASLMAGGGGASTRAVPRGFNQAARIIAGHMEAAGGASRRAV
jgi:hypothetical protein